MQTWKQSVHVAAACLITSGNEATYSMLIKKITWQGMQTLLPMSKMYILVLYIVMHMMLYNMKHFSWWKTVNFHQRQHQAKPALFYVITNSSSPLLSSPHLSSPLLSPPLLSSPLLSSPLLSSPLLSSPLLSSPLLKAQSMGTLRPALSVYPSVVITWPHLFSGDVPDLKSGERE